LNSNNLEETFLSFREQCIWLQTCFNTFMSLYESGERVQHLMEVTAPHFFRDLNIILIEYGYLQVCRLSDPASSFGRDNLTVEHINLLLKSESKLTSEILKASEGIVKYRTFIKASRNRFISHADKRSILAGQPIGEHPREEIDKFFKSLYCYVDEVGNAIGVGPLDFRCTSGPGDVYDLIRYLEAGLTSLTAK